MVESAEGQVYKLRCTLLGHSMDVRGVAIGQMESGKDFIVSGSRDRSAKVWTPSETGCGFTQLQSCEGHTNFISCVYVIPPNDKYPSGLILSGSHDHTILAFELGKHQPVFRLVGHKGTVCSISGTSDSLIVSGSWDQSAKVWSDQTLLATLTGHQAAVWAVATVPSSDHKILTGSADKEIRLWTNYQPTTTYKGHTDCVRALAVVSSDKFLSGSNDASIRLWSISGETLEVFYGHTNFIYSLSLLPDQEGFVSVGEDRSLRIWKRNETVQVLYHPATSVWSVSTLRNGDIVTGSSDGTVRVFSRAPERMGTPDAISAWEEEVSKSVVAAQQDLGGMKVSELPGPESLYIEGKSDGETKMVREGDKVGCFSWSQSEKKWTKIGDVVGASGATQNTSGKVLHEGKEYDYVFTVDLDGQGTLKLPYNVTEDPWFAAQKFIHKNELSQLFLDQVANFIINNTKGMQLGSAAASSDPFTGGDRYVPGSGSDFSGSGGGGGGLDPFTGSGAYTTSTIQSQPAKSSGSASELNNSSFPIKEFVRFSTVPNYDNLKKKLIEFSGTSEVNIDTLLDIGRSPHWTSEVESLVKNCLASWPPEKVFPILDLLRLSVLNSAFALSLNHSLNLPTSISSSYFSSSIPTNQMLSLRLLSNCFGPLTSSLMSERHLVVSRLLSNPPKGKMNEIAAATLLLNYSIATSSTSSTSNTESQTEVLMAAFQLMEMVEDPEALFRLLVSVGNLISANGQMGSLFLSLGGDTILQNYRNNALLPKVKNCAEHIDNLVKDMEEPGPSRMSS